MKKHIHFSRHAKRRMQLYDLSEEDVLSVIVCQDPELHFGDGKHQIVSETKFTRQGYPIKVAFACESGIITIITAYPLKRGLK